MGNSWWCLIALRSFGWQTIGAFFLFVWFAETDFYFGSPYLYYTTLPANCQELFRNISNSFSRTGRTDATGERQGGQRHTADAGEANGSPTNAKPGNPTNAKEPGTKTKDGRNRNKQDSKAPETQRAQRNPEPKRNRGRKPNERPGGSPTNEGGGGGGSLFLGLRCFYSIKAYSLFICRIPLL